MKIAIITGASSGMGKLFAYEIDKEEADEIWLIARRTELLEEISAKMKNKTRILSLDLLKKESFDEIKTLLTDDIEISYLVNAAGFGEFGECGVTPLESEMKMIDLNVKATVAMCSVCASKMAKGGHIVNLGSASVFNPLPYFNIYASTKSFIRHYSRALYYEMKPRGVYVSVFCPGWVKTEFFNHTKEESAPRSPKKYSPMLNSQKCVRYAMKNIRKGKVLVVYNSYTKLQHLLSKILPSSVLCRLWLGMLKENK